VPRTAHEGKVSRWTCIALAASGRRASDDAERVALDLRPFTQLDRLRAPSQKVHYCALHSSALNYG
jgi:hypothetical protein